MNLIDSAELYIRGTLTSQVGLKTTSCKASNKMWKPVLQNNSWSGGASHTLHTHCTHTAHTRGRTTKHFRNFPCVVTIF